MVNDRRSPRQFEWLGGLKPIQLLIGLPLVIALVWSAVNPFPIYAPSKVLIGGFLVVLLLSLLFLGGVSGAAALVAGLAILAIMIGTLFSPAWRTSLEAAFVPYIAVALFLFVAAGLERRWLMMAVAAAAGVLALVAVIGLVNEVTLWHEVIREVAPSSSFWERMPVTLPRTGIGGLHPNETAMVAALSLPLAIVGWRRFKDFRTFWGLAIVAIGGMLIATGSRGGALAGSAAVVVTLWLITGRNQRFRRRWIVAALIASAALVVGLLLMTITNFRPDFIFRDTVQARIPVWGAGWRMFLDSPWVGHGAGSFSWLADEYLGTTYPGVEARRIWNEAHSGYIHLLVQSGVIGFIAITAAIGIVVRRCWDQLKGGGLKADYAASVLGGIVGFMIFSVFEASTASLAPLIFAAVIGAAVFVDSSSDGQSWSGKFVSASVVVPPLVFLILTLPAQFDYERGARAAFGGNWGQALVAFDEAASKDSHPLYERAAAVASTYAGTTDVERIESAAELAPFDSAAYLNFLLIKSEDAESLSDVTERLRAEEVIVLTTGSIHDQSGNRDVAFASYRWALAMNPWLVGSSVWQELLPDTRSIEALYEEVLTTEPCSVSDIFFLHGIDLSSVAALIEQTCSKSGRANLALALQRGDRDGVVAKALGRLSSVPEDIAMRRIAAVALADTDPEVSRTHLAIASLLGDPWSALALSMQIDAGSSHASVVQVLVRNASGRSPVFPQEDTISVYRFSGIRTRIVDRRVEIPTTLVRGYWIDASTRIHDGIATRIDVLR